MSRDLLALGGKLMAQAKVGPDVPAGPQALRRAVVCRNGLNIALLMA